MFLWWRRAHNSCSACGVVQHGSIEKAATPSKNDQHQIQRVSQLDIIYLLATHGTQIDRQIVRDKTPRSHAQAASESPETSNPSFNRAAAVYLLKKLEIA